MPSNCAVNLTAAMLLIRQAGNLTVGLSNHMNPSEPCLLLTVEEAFLISGRGCLLTPGLSLERMPSIKRGDNIRLVLPGGEVAESIVHCLDAVHNRNAETPEVRFFLTLPPTVKKSDVPNGTKVFWKTGNDGNHNAQPFNLADA